MAYLLLLLQQLCVWNGIDPSQITFDQKIDAALFGKVISEHEIQPFPVKACRQTATSKNLTDVIRQPLICICRHPMTVPAGWHSVADVAP